MWNKQKHLFAYENVKSLWGEKGETHKGSHSITGCPCEPVQYAKVFFSFFFFKKIRLRQDIRVWSGEQSQRDTVELTCNPPRWKQRQREGLLCSKQQTEPETAKW